MQKNQDIFFRHKMKYDNHILKSKFPSLAFLLRIGSSMNDVTKSNAIFGNHTFTFLVQRGHSNYTWHFLGAFLPPPPCDIFPFLITDFKTQIALIDDLESILNSVSKSKKKLCDTLSTPPPMRVSRMIWMNPNALTNPSWTTPEQKIAIELICVNL